MVSRICLGRGTIRNRLTNTSDFEVLGSCLLNNLVNDAATNLAHFNDCPIVVTDKHLHDALNDCIVATKAFRAGKRVCLLVAQDRFQCQPLSDELALGVIMLGLSVTNNYLGILPMFPSMKVMVMENLVQPIGVVNSAKGVLLDVKYQ